MCASPNLDIRNPTVPHAGAQRKNGRRADQRAPAHHMLAAELHRDHKRELARSGRLSACNGRPGHHEAGRDSGRRGSRAARWNRKGEKRVQSHGDWWG